MQLVGLYLFCVFDFWFKGKFIIISQNIILKYILLVIQYFTRKSMCCVSSVVLACAVGCAVVR